MTNKSLSSISTITQGVQQQTQSTLFPRTPLGMLVQAVTLGGFNPDVKGVPRPCMMD
jgi:hypothetical protein